MIKVNVKMNTDKFLENLSKNIDERMEKSGTQILNLAKRLCPVDTGKLRDDIDMVYNEKTITIFNTLNYAPFVLLGTRYQKPNNYLDTALFQAIIRKNWKGKVSNG